MFIDTHCHISYDDDNFESVIKEMKNNIMIVSGCDSKSNKEVVKLVNEYPNIYGVIGLHPDQADKVNDCDLNFLEKNINNPKIVGIGEIGLDYYYTKENSDLQKELFLKQIKIAMKNNKTIVIHSREAMKDTIDILDEMNVKKAVMHCYSGSLETAKYLIKKGIKLGIGGVVTFKNATKLQEIVKELPLENFLLETDSPYLSPHPFRGEVNRPYNSYYVGLKIAELKGISEEEVFKNTTLNAINQFDLPLDF